MPAGDSRVEERQVGVEVPAEISGRLDRFLAEHPDLNLSRSRVQQLIKEGRIRLADGEEKVKPSLAIEPGMRFLVEIPAPESLETVAEEIPLDILFEDQDLIVINKPRGMVVHPAAGNPSGTLVNALLGHCHDLSGINGALRPGIVHRLDKDTTGILVAAKNDQTHRSLAQQLKEHTMDREYTALVHGSPEVAEGTIDAPVGRHPVQRKRMAVTPGKGKAAVTHFRVLERLGPYTLLACRLETGRTHQIRVHLAYIGHPVVDDPVYAGRRRGLGLGGQALHAGLLGFTHPRTGERHRYEAPLPPDFAAVLERLRARSISTCRPDRPARWPGTPGCRT